MGTKAQDHTTTQVSRPPEWLEPYIQRNVGRAEDLYRQGGLYPSTELPQTAQAGFQAAQAAAGAPQLIDPAVQYTQGVLGGDYLGADALRQASRAELDDVINRQRSQFALAGRTGSPGESYALGRGITAGLSPAYRMERGLQQGAAAMAPGLEAARYGPGQAQVGLGMQQRGLEERYYQEPWQRLQMMNQTALGGAPAGFAGGTQTTTQPVYGPSPLGQIAGLGLAGLGLAGGLGWAPFAGAGAGAGIPASTMGTGWSPFNPYFSQGW